MAVALTLCLRPKHSSGMTIRASQPASLSALLVWLANLAAYLGGRRALFRPRALAELFY